MDTVTDNQLRTLYPSICNQKRDIQLYTTYFQNGVLGLSLSNNDNNDDDDDEIIIIIIIIIMVY